MKIAHICQSYPPMISGAAISVAQLATGMAEAGHELLIITASDKPASYTTQIGHVRIERLASWHNPFRVGQRFLMWPGRQIRESIGNFEPDIVHLHEPLALGVCGLLAARQFGVPVVVTLHQLPWFITKYLPENSLPIDIERPLWRYGSWFLSQCAAHIVPMNHVATVVRERTGHHSQVIPYGANLIHFNSGNEADNEERQLRRQYGLRPNSKIMLHVGRLDADKNVGDVILAAAEVMKHVDAELLVVGDGTKRQALLRDCAALGIADRSHFTGYVQPDRELPSIYSLADLFVTASEIETFGIVLLEAMAAALPVVAYQATCIPDLVEDNGSGFLVPAGDIEQLSHKMIKLLLNPRKAAKMGRRGQEISQRYTLKSMVEQHVQLYDSILQPELSVGTLINVVSPKTAWEQQTNIA